MPGRKRTPDVENRDLSQERRDRVVLDLRGQVGARAAGIPVSVLGGQALGSGPAVAAGVVPDDDSQQLRNADVTVTEAESGTPGTSTRGWAWPTASRSLPSGLPSRWL